MLEAMQSLRDEFKTMQKASEAGVRSQILQHHVQS